LLSKGILIVSNVLIFGGTNDSPASILTKKLDYMLRQYYKLQGWDLRMGWIPRSRLRAPSLEDVAKQLAKLKKLP